MTPQFTVAIGGGACVDCRPNSRPSATDRKLTEELMKAAEIMTIPLLDHVLIGLRERYSFADHGLIEEYRRRRSRPTGSG